ncbi:MAG: metallophosphoesterase [Magnetococcales bacterium]|nr:metallophosphoesterase [Magnetococcales bacterium]
MKCFEHGMMMTMQRFVPGWIGCWLILLAGLWPSMGMAQSESRTDRIVFFALGDQGTGNEDQHRVARAMEQVAARDGGVDGVLLLGDNFYPDGVASVQDPQWQTKFETVYAGPMLAKVPFYATLGNHDVRTNGEAQIDYARQRLGSKRWHMEGHHYFLDQGRTSGGQPLLRLVILDGQEKVKRQEAFVHQAFSGTGVRPVWRWVASHYPLRSSGEHGNSKKLLKRLLPALQSQRVDLHLSGHDHHLEVLQPPGEPLMVVSGGGGQRLYSLGEKSEWSKFFAERFGFARIAATVATLAVTMFDDQGAVLHQTILNAIP